MIASVRRAAAPLVLLTVLASSGCGDSTPKVRGVKGADITAVSSIDVPATLLGMKVQRENVTKTVKDVQQTYVTSLSVFSFRRDKLLQATLQISQFSAGAATTSAGFRESVLAQLGGTTPQQVRLGSTQVYLTTATSQSLAVWFRDQYFFVLATRGDFEQPRTLIRAVLDIHA